MDKSSPSKCSNSEAAEEEAAEDLTWELLYFHWSGHAMLFTGAFIATYVTGDIHLTGGAVLLFVASGIIGFANERAPFRRYAVAYGLYTPSQHSSQQAGGQAMQRATTCTRHSACLSISSARCFSTLPIKCKRKTREAMIPAHRVNRQSGGKFLFIGQARENLLKKV